MIPRPEQAVPCGRRQLTSPRRCYPASACGVKPGHLRFISHLRASPGRRLDSGTDQEQCSGYVPAKEAEMLKTFVEEAAALTSIVLFVGMIAVWAQVIPQL
ncbi:hypothetical protein RPC_2432 [Rhodopseudomonas palustris BisB18]|uniref:Uncharacterized protein n=1 Tax=Rhodopseudomonas palustris (strain BisB18) TaxID=316056 RepID=Q215F3_RHOPB